MCADETAEMSAADRVRSVLVLLRHTRGEASTLRQALDERHEGPAQPVEPVHISDLQYLA